MIGVESLFRLLDIKENLNDPRSLYQITELLKPIEYTRVDKLIDVIFYTSQDISAPENPEIRERPESSLAIGELVLPSRSDLGKEPGTHSSPVNFYEKCIARINRKLGRNFIKNGRVTYTSADKQANVVLLNSKSYPETHGLSFWYGFRPNQDEFLSEKDASFVAFGCGSEESLLLIPFQHFKTFLSKLGTSLDSDGTLKHSHVVIFETDSKYSIRVGDKYVDISEFAI